MLDYESRVLDLRDVVLLHANHIEAGYRGE